jgi:D-glycero-alpha-D-manno-heptose-7-phosphate kinase
MIVTRAPLRVSFLGGGSDLPEWYDREHGAVLSAAIDRYIYVVVHPSFERRLLRVAYTEVEVVERRDFLKHDLARACLQHVGIETGLEINSVADIPTAGSGLGGSSAYVCALMRAFLAHKAEAVPPHVLANCAYHIERDNAGAVIGRQDALASAYGGVNLFQFCPGEPPKATPIGHEAFFRDRILLVWTGVVRKAADILEPQAAKTKAGLNARHLRRMTFLALQGADAIRQGDFAGFAEMVAESWELKKHLAGGISIPIANDIIEQGKAAGALAGKLLGAGGGGFVLLLGEPDAIENIIERLRVPRVLMPGIDREGAKVVYDSRAT